MSGEFSHTQTGLAIPLLNGQLLTLLHSERPKLYGVLVVLSAIGLKEEVCFRRKPFPLLIDYFGMAKVSRKTNSKSSYPPL